MSFTEEENPVESLVDNLTIDEPEIDASALSLGSTEFVQEFSTIEEQSSEEMVTIDSLQSEDQEESVVIKTEDKKNPSMPPLRPLTIAPKPAKVPVALKPVTGQQLILVQGPGAGQPIKLISTTQGLNLSNLSIAKPITIKTTPTTSVANTLGRPKKVLMKKVGPKTLTKTMDSKPGQQIFIVQKQDGNTKQLTTAPQAKTLTLAQAQQLGLLNTSKLITSTPKQIVIGKPGAPKEIRVVPRSPTKILPAPQSANKTGQRIFLKPANVTAGQVVPTQVIQVPTTAQAGQLHQINIPGKGVQYIKFVTSGQQSSPQEVAVSKAAAASTTKLIPLSTVAAARSGKPVLKPMAKVCIPGSSKTIAIPLSTTQSGQLIIPKSVQVNTKIIPLKTATTTASTEQFVNIAPKEEPQVSNTMESNGMKTRKPCNCSKSQCLKLYCECFANGEFCFMCNCVNCYNNLDFEEHRQRAIKNCLERNPNAFRPKIGKGKETGEMAVRKHTKGCNCKRSNCLKNYCECYEAKIVCSSNCKCLGCKNVENLYDASSRNSDSSLNASPPPSKKSQREDAVKFKKAANRQAFNYINSAVIEATSQCLLTMSKSAEEMGQDEETTRKEIIEEFGRCLKQIIDCSNKKETAEVEN